MIAKHGMIYFGSRVVAAAGNLAAILLFTRLAGPEVYGRYLTAMAIAVVATSFAVQWCRYAYFEVYRPADEGDLFKTYMAIVAACIVVTGAALAALAPFLGWPPDVTVAAIGLMAANSLFDTTLEMSRTQLKPGAVAWQWIARTVLVLVIGSLVLAATRDALALAMGVTLAYGLVLAPGLVRRYWGNQGRFSARQARGLLGFGSPLVLAFGFSSLAQNLDRLMLGHFAGLAAVGSYVALSDLIRANMMLLAEVLNITVISIAKRQHDQGEVKEARHNLAIAYRLMLLLGGFGGSAILLFGQPIFDLLLPAKFHLDNPFLLPLITLSAVLLLIRNNYFAQVIYFSGRSQIDLYAAVILLVSIAIFGAVLIPRDAALGAAVAFLAGQVVTLAFYLSVGRRAYALPTPLGPTIAVAMISAGLFAVHLLLDASGQVNLVRYGAEFVLWAASLVVTTLAWTDRATRARAFGMLRTASGRITRERRKRQGRSRWSNI